MSALNIASMEQLKLKAEYVSREGYDAIKESLKQYDATVRWVPVRKSLDRGNVTVSIQFRTAADCMQNSRQIKAMLRDHCITLRNL